MVPYIYCCLIIYGLDRVTRLVKTRTQSAFIQQVPELNAVRLEIPSLNAGWRAGQHVRIRVLSMGMGIMGWSEIHPFTIASASDSPNGVVLLVKQAGDWTKALYMLAGPTGRYGREDNLSEKSPVRQVTVMVEGPYGECCAVCGIWLILRGQGDRATPLHQVSAVLSSWSVVVVSRSRPP